MQSSKDIFTRYVCRLMDNDFEYQDALKIVLILFNGIDKKGLEKELDKYV